ncbi:MAG: methyltransferase domain-containing protein [Euryarchaeota archaeon]|nr:methyltransferase domain-containing protein [Euryarchaeota archaeon]MBV1755385.1 methyltransferase domain-containing protein [Methanobacterium sp.]MBV1767035.1 methyltransferase domain-containing protein [Methanobacterium sp.]
MKTTDESVIESVVVAMDGPEKDIFPFIPCLVQDLWEFGTDAELVMQLIYQHQKDYSKLKILDLGCGKGPVSIKLAKKFNCHCWGIDAVEEFIHYARKKAEEYQVSELCHFVVGDIREEIKNLHKFDIVILGAIGPVLGDYYTTLEIISKSLNKRGMVIIDDAYMDNGDDISSPLILKKSEILKQISNAGMSIIQELVMDKEYIEKSNDYIFKNIKKRAGELENKYPDKKSLFQNYIKAQEEENKSLETRLTCSVMLIGTS